MSNLKCFCPVCRGNSSHGLSQEQLQQLQRPQRLVEPPMTETRRALMECAIPTMTDRVTAVAAIERHTAWLEAKADLMGGPRRD